MSCDSSVSREAGYSLDDRDSFPCNARYFSLHHHVQSGSESHPASCLKCSRGYLPEGKVAGV